ncbi:DUF2807 domain-containing protein [Flavobacteriaceae bacterium GSB9]|nr:DUF2807 domain-containing protein [Flavobacteriaceae bacterium GSB9]
MNNKLLYMLILLCPFAIEAQEKVKGSRNVTIERIEISPFHTINLDEDFEVEIIFNQIPSIEIETDDNLHDYIEFKVVDSVLTFNKKARIRSKKRLNIKVAYNNALKYINTTEDAEILSLVTMDLNQLTVNAKASSKVGLTLKTNAFKLETDDRAKLELNITSENSSLFLSGNSKIEALVNTVNLTGTLYQRADIEIEGACNNAQLELDNYAHFNGKNFTINSCNVICNISSDAELEVMDSINIEASGSSTISLYENPKIIINKMTDTSRLEKKVK